jgi:hypothetical protein
MNTTEINKAVTSACRIFGVSTFRLSGTTVELTPAQVEDFIRNEVGEGFVITNVFSSQTALIVDEETDDGTPMRTAFIPIREPRFVEPLVTFG